MPFQATATNSSVTATEHSNVIHDSFKHAKFIPLFASLSRKHATASSEEAEAASAKLRKQRVKRVTKRGAMYNSDFGQLRTLL